MSVFFGEAQELLNIEALVRSKEYLSQLEPAANILRERLENKVIRNDTLINYGADLKATIGNLELRLKNKDNALMSRFFAKKPLVSIKNFA